MQQAIEAPEVLVQYTVNSLQIPRFTARVLHSLLSLSQCSAATVVWLYWFTVTPPSTSLMFSATVGTLMSLSIVLNLSLVAELINYHSLKLFRFACKGAMVGNAALGILSLVFLLTVKDSHLITQILFGFTAIQSLTIMVAQGMILNRQLAKHIGHYHKKDNYLFVQDTTF